MTAVPFPAQTALLMESGNPQIGVVPIAYAVAPTGPTAIAYPPAVREYWAYELGQQNAAYPGNVVNPIHDEARAAFGGVMIGHADGSAKFYPLGRFLSQTPTAAEYGVAASAPNNYTAAPGPLRGFTGGTITLGAMPNLMVNYPLWGLGVQ